MCCWNICKYFRWFGNSCDTFFPLYLCLYKLITLRLNSYYECEERDLRNIQLTEQKEKLCLKSPLTSPLFFFTTGLWTGLNHTLDHFKVIITLMIFSRLNSTFSPHSFHKILWETEMKDIITCESSLLFLFLTSCTPGNRFLPI